MTLNPTPNFREQIARDKQNGFNVRDEFKGMTVEEIRTAQTQLAWKMVHERNAVQYDVCFLNFTGDLNIGMGIRTALMLGATRVFLFGRREYDTRSTVGAHNYIDVVRVDGLDENFNIDYNKFFELMDTNFLTPIAVEHGGGRAKTITLPLTTDARNKLLSHCVISDQGPNNRFWRPCFVFGNESFGLPPAVLDKVPTILEIPQYGVLRSFNAASAVSMVLYDWVFGA